MSELEITPEEVRELRDAGEPFTLLDVREPWELQTARISGSTNIVMNEIPARVAELERNAPIVVICHHGVRSLNVTAWLRRQGFTNVRSMRGGIDAWSRSIDPNVPVY